MSVAVLVPVLGRPERVEPLVQSLADSLDDAEKLAVAVHLLVSPEDTPEQEAIERVWRRTLPITVGRMTMPFEAGPGDYARKLNRAYRDLVADGVGGAELYEWALLGADDLLFHPGWLRAALACHEQTGACVIGTNDMGNAKVMRGDHSTHTMVHARYAECGTIDEPGKLLHEGYDHNFVDNELVGTALHRETFAFAAECRVEHLHPIWRKGEQDATYAKGQRRFGDDRVLFESRRHLWGER